MDVLAAFLTGCRRGNGPDWQPNRRRFSKRKTGDGFNVLN
jgi:hypothetical protein